MCTQGTGGQGHGATYPPSLPNRSPCARRALRQVREQQQSRLRHPCLNPITHTAPFWPATCCRLQIAPCRCSGSTKWVHQRCLLRWVHLFPTPPVSGGSVLGLGQGRVATNPIAALHWVGRWLNDPQAGQPRGKVRDLVSLWSAEVSQLFFNTFYIPPAPRRPTAARRVWLH